MIYSTMKCNSKNSKKLKIKYQYYYTNIKIANKYNIKKLKEIDFKYKNFQNKTKDSKDYIDILKQVDANSCWVFLLEEKY